MSWKEQLGQDNLLSLGSKVGNFLDPADASDDAGMFETVKQHIFGGMEESAHEGTDRYQAIVLSVSRYASSTSTSQAITRGLLKGLNIGIRPRFIVRARVDTLHSHIPDPCQYINQGRSTENSSRRDIATLLHPVFIAEANSGIIPNDGTNAAGTALPRPNPGDKIWVRFDKGPSAGVMRGGYYIGLIQKALPGTIQNLAGCDLTALTALDGGNTEPLNAMIPDPYAQGEFAEGEPSGITLHYTVTNDIPTAEAVLKLDGNLYHYIIDRDGTVKPLLDPTQVGIHDEAKNKTNIGIAMVNMGFKCPHATGIDTTTMCQESGGSSWEVYTTAQLSALTVLVSQLGQQFPGQITRVERHSHNDSSLDKKDPGPMLSDDMIQTLTGLAKGA